MKKIVVSDLHGCGDIYFPLMKYLDNIASKEEVTLFINGDLIDRGNDSYLMFWDVYKRIMGSGNVKICYLGGNHELMMYKSLLFYKDNERFPFFNDWILNGGGSFMEKINGANKELIDKYISFVGNLDIYHVFDEKIQDKKILLVHAKAPKDIDNNCNLKISDDNKMVYKAVWTREVDEFYIPHKLGDKDYFTIIGHTPVSGGFYYNRRQNYFNIDGGCSGYALGYKYYNKVPVIEIEDEKLSIIMFNHDNEIIDGYYFDGIFSKMSRSDVKIKRKYLIK